MPWDPTQYLRFAEHRTRPAVDLLSRIPLTEPRTVYDLGSGPGNATRLLRDRWPAARITGVDASVEMLEGDDPVKEWAKGSALKPLLDALPAADRDRFESRYAELVGAAYPRRPDRRTLFPFARLFIVATR